jgi:competence ComEA-like helix-hairpin-helix protein
MTRSESRGLVLASLMILLASAARLGLESTHRHGEAGGGPSVLDSLLSASEAELADRQRREAPLAQGERVSLARAEAWEFDRLPGVGPAMADSIVALRARRGVLRSPADLLEVRGIGPATVERLRPFLVEQDRPGPRPGVGEGSARIRLNRATSDELESLPGVGPALALRIVEARRIRGGFSSLDELQEVRGIGPVLLSRLRPLLELGR